MVAIELCNKDTQPSQTCSEGYTFSKNNCTSNSERKTVLLAGFFPGDIRVTVDD